jgi:hypothetical protein
MDDKMFAVFVEFDDRITPTADRVEMRQRVRVP